MTYSSKLPLADPASGKRLRDLKLKRQARPKQLENLSAEEFDRRLDEIESQSIEQVRTNKDQFLSDHPSLDFRNKK